MCDTPESESGKYYEEPCLFKDSSIDETKKRCIGNWKILSTLRDSSENVTTVHNSCALHASRECHTCSFRICSTTTLAKIFASPLSPTHRSPNPKHPIYVQGRSDSRQKLEFHNNATRWQCTLPRGTVHMLTLTDSLLAHLGTVECITACGTEERVKA